MAPKQANSALVGETDRLDLVLVAACRHCGRRLGRFVITDADAYYPLAFHDLIRAAIIGGDLQRVRRTARGVSTGTGLYYEEWPPIDDAEYHLYLVKVCKCGSRGRHEERHRVEKVDFELRRERGRDVVYL